MDVNVFDSVFWITTTGLIITFLVAIMNTCLKSKCKKCTLCCGAIIVERNVDAEVEEEKEEMENNINPYEVTRIV
jgi:hypothetical protein